MAKTVEDYIVDLYNGINSLTDAHNTSMKNITEEMKELHARIDELETALYGMDDIEPVDIKETN